MFLNVAAELGLPAALVIGVSLSVWFVSACVSAAQPVSVRCAIAFFVAVFIHSMVEFPLWYAYVLMPMGLLIGMVHVQRWPDCHCWQRPRWFVGSGAALAIAAAIIFSWDFQRVKAGVRSTDEIAFYGEGVDERMQQPALTFSSGYFDYFDVLIKKVTPQMTVTEINQFERVTQRFPFRNLLYELS